MGDLREIIDRLVGELRGALLPGAHPIPVIRDRNHREGAGILKGFYKTPVHAKPQAHHDYDGGRADHDAEDSEDGPRPSPPEISGRKL